MRASSSRAGTSGSRPAVGENIGHSTTESHGIILSNQTTR